jgi:predicted phage terminase large subunit-like protein
VTVDELTAQLEADPAWLAQLDEEQLAALCAELSEDDLADFERWLGNMVPERANPATFAAWLTAAEPEPFQLWRHTVHMAEHLARAGAGDDSHQIHMVGSQYGKTTLLMWFVLWLLDRNPRLRIMYVSHAQTRATAFGRSVRDLVKRHAKQLRFHLRTDLRAAGMWQTDQGGGLYCVGVDGQITGFPQDVLLCDDLFKGWEMAHSPSQREHVWNVYTSQCRFRLQKNTDPVVHVGTRWHEDDVPSRLLAKQEGDPNADRWYVVRLPTFAEAPEPTAKDPLLRLPDPLGRAVGELLCPERFDAKEALARKANLAMYLWAAMEQQRPSPIEGTIFKRGWWQLDTERAWRGVADAWISSWDMKLKGKKTGDFVVGQVWARIGAHYWLVDMYRGQWDQPTVENAVALCMVRWPQINIHVMENTGNGPEVMTALRTRKEDYVLDAGIADALGMSAAERDKVQVLRRRGLPGILPNNPKGDKLTRAIAITGAVQSGNVHVLPDELWLPDFLEEMAAFTGHGDAHDDVVDATTQAVNYFLGGGGGAIQTATDALLSVRAG